MLNINIDIKTHAEARFILNLSEITNITLPSSKRNDQLAREYSNVEIIGVDSNKDVAPLTHNHLENYIEFDGIRSLGPHFPLSFFKDEEEKTIDYLFIGLKTKDRLTELKDFLQYCEWTNSGRVKHRFYDNYYFSKLNKTRFALCPVGGCSKWTYRFYEAILMKCIPILSKTQINNMFKRDRDNYIFYELNDKHIYDKNIVNKNYDTLLCFMEKEFAEVRNRIILDNNKYMDKT